MGFSSRGGHRLFHDDMLPRLKRGDRWFAVRFGVRANTDGIHLRKREQFTIVSKCVFRSPLLRCGLRPFLKDICDPHNPCFIGNLEVSARMCTRNPARTDDTNTNRHNVLPSNHCKAVLAS